MQGWKLNSCIFGCLIMIGFLYSVSCGYSDDTNQQTKIKNAEIENRKSKIENPPLNLQPYLDSGLEPFKQGRFEEAVAIWEKALDQVTQTTPVDIGIVLDITTYLSDAYKALGHHQKAVAVVKHVLPLLENSKDEIRNAQILGNLGDLYLSLGDIGHAVEYFEKAVEHARNANDPLVLANVLNNVANALAVVKDFDGAMGAYGECIDVLTEMKTESTVRDELLSTVLINTARLSYLNKKFDDMENALNYAMVKINELPNTHKKASDLIALGLLTQKVYLDMDDDESASNLLIMAHDQFNFARQVAEELKDYRTLSYALGYLGQLYETEQRYDEAVKLTHQAIFYAQQEYSPEILYLWQWQLGRLFKELNQEHKAIEAYENAIQTLNPIRTELFHGFRNQEDAFNLKVKPVYLGLADLLLNQEVSLTETNSRETKLKEARDVMETLKTAELQEFFQDECVTEMQSKMTKIDRTPEHTAVIYPIMLPTRLVVIFTLPDGIKQIQVNVDSQTVIDTVLRYRKRLQTRSSNRFLLDSHKLYDWIIRPLTADIEKYQIDTLVIAPDGALRLIPFSTLNDGEKFLVEKFAVGTIPAISLTDLKAMDPNPTILLSGLSEARHGFSALPSVTKEILDIREIMSGKIALRDKEYTLDNLSKEFTSNEYTIVHLATHGVFGGTPQDSFLLTYDSQLSMDKLQSLFALSRYREKKVELLTLSACQTALGNERAALGLAGAAVKAGVKSVVATLWYVDDEATSLAIREFYRQLRTPGITKTKAMQNAQKMLLSKPRYRHPLYWAPFLVIGSWL
ncbi:MAG: CHAT domain-containing protein [Desulfobacterales bacterium]|nr:CHAT domain-containing protein [Desulfobacterales bacterium]